MTNFVRYAAALRGALSGLVLKIRPETERKNTRNAFARLTRALRPQKGRSLAQNIEGLVKAAEEFESTTSAYLTPEDIAARKTGDFDGMNLLSWLEIVKTTDIPLVPARVIASLSAGEMNVASGEIPADNLAKIKILKQMRELQNDICEEHNPETTDDRPTKDSVFRKLADAMDTVGYNEMVRYSRCGGTNLKTIAGAGVAGPLSPNVTFSASLETGPGWIRRGNIRFIDAQDMRIIECASKTPESYTHQFVARPWIASSRYLLENDPHRDNTPVQGPGAWPAEWRAFVCNGVVTGVSAYYAWAHKGEEQDSIMAELVRQIAQKIVDTAIAMNLRPAFFANDVILPDAMNQEDSPLKKNPNFDNLIKYTEELPPGGFNCTLDFLETANGPTFLEAGPPILPLGMPGEGAHPIAFGTGLAFDMFAYPDVHGMALSQNKNMKSDTVKEWHTFDRNETIFPWPAAE